MNNTVENNLCLTDLSVNISNIILQNPLILASGFLGISQSIFNRLHKSGLGAIVSKSISLTPREGYKGPTIVSVNEQSYVNAIGLANPGVVAFAKEISNNTIPLFVSLVGSSHSDFPKMIKKFDKLNILGYEINLSCPHVAKMGMEVGDDPELVRKIIKIIKSNTKKPVIIKVGIGNTDILKLSQVIKDSGADAITAINTIRAMSIDPYTARPLLSNKIGGLSGRSIKPIGVRCVYEIYQNIDIPIIGCGGIFTWEDVLEYIFAGASAVEIGSAIGYGNLNKFKKIIKGLENYMQKKGYKNLKEMQGIAHKY